MITKPKFDAETVIADFLGDLYDCHPRVGGLNSSKYERLRELAKVLISDLAEQDIAVSSQGGP
jgi:hypothetical protein